MDFQNQQPAPTPPNPAQPQPGQQSPYDFILNNEKPKKTLIPTQGSSKKQRIILFGAGLAILLVLAVIVMSLVSGIGGSNKKNLVAVAQQQNEIARVAGIGTQKARSNATLVFANNTAYSMQSGQNQVMALLKKKKMKVNNKELALLKSSSTDQKLTAAATAGQFDDVFNPILVSALKKYQSQLQTDYKNASSKSEKDLYKYLYDQTVILLKNVPLQATVTPGS